MEQVSYEHFTKLDIRIGKIIAADAVAGADRLIELKVDIGESEPRTLVAGLKQYYTPAEMVDKKIVVLVNLEPRKMKGILSNGMLLAASTPGFEDVKVLTVEGDMPVGSRVS